MAFDFSKITSALSSNFKKFDMNLKHADTSTIIGVDFGSSSIKVVQIKLEEVGATLETYGELQLGPYAGFDVGRTTSIPVGKLTEAFVDIVRESAVTSKDVALAIPFASTFSVIIPVEAPNEEALGPMMPVIARKYVPTSLNEVTLDWFRIPPKPNEEKMQVFLAAIHHDALEKYHGVIDNAALKTKFTEIEIFSTLRSTIAADHALTAVIDLGASASKLYIVRNGITELIHSVRTGGTELTQTIAKELNIAFGEAEGIKRQYGIRANGPNPEAGASMHKVIDRGFRELHQVITRFEEHGGQRVENVILCGGGAMLSGLTAYVQDRIQLTVVLADPFAKLAYPAFLEDTLKEIGPTFSVAIGAALRLLQE